jgi:DNA-binding response OmpR family regulator
MRALAGHRVLIVEDELLIALDIADALKGAGAEVVVSRTVGDALSQAETQSFTAAAIDLVLYDGITASDVRMANWFTNRQALATLQGVLAG